MVRFTRSVPAVLLLLGALAACTADVDETSTGAVDDASQARPAQSAQPSPAEVGRTEGDAGAQPSVSPAPVTRGIAVQVPVERPGALPDDQRLAAPVVPFDRAAVYADGVTIVVRDVVHAVTTGTGVGAQPGQPVTSVTLQLRNGSPDPVDLNAVVVSAVSGAARAPASPVYGEGQDDFAGVVRPGATRAATYTFSIPPSELDEVSLTVDVDGKHRPAVWRGSLR